MNKGLPNEYIKEEDESSAYLERMKAYFVVNKIKEEEMKIASFISSMRGKFYNWILYVIW